MLRVTPVIDHKILGDSPACTWIKNILNQNCLLTTCSQDKYLLVATCLK